MSIYIFNTDGTSREVPTDETVSAPSLDELKDWIGNGCDMIEIVNVWWMGQREQMIVDESGLVRDPPQEFNPIGFGLYVAMALANGFPLRDAVQNMIVGNVVLLTGEHKLD